MDRENARAAARNFMSENRKSLLRDFLDQPAVQIAIKGGASKDKIVKWAKRLLGINRFMHPEIENDFVRFYMDDKRAALGKLPEETRYFLYRQSIHDLLKETELHTLNGSKKRDAYNPLLAVNGLEDYEIANKLKEVESPLHSSIAGGKGPVVPVYGGSEVTVPVPSTFAVPGLGGKILTRMLEKFGTGGLASLDGFASKKVQDSTHGTGGRKKAVN